MRTRITIIAITNRICMNPPMVWEVTIPSSHRIMSITLIVQSIGVLLMMYYYTPKYGIWD